MSHLEASQKDRGDWASRVLDGMPGLVLVSRAGRITFVNANGAGLLGYGGADSLSGQPLSVVGLYEDRLEAVSLGSSPSVLSLVRADGSRQEVSAVVRKGDGEWLIQAEPVSAIDGRLARSDAYRQLVDLSHECMCICHDEIITFINSGGVALFGADSARAMIGQALIDFVHPDYADILVDGLSALCDEREPVPVKVRSLQGRDIDLEMVVMRVGPVEDNSFMIEARDVSEARRALAALHDKEARLQGILDTVGDGIVSADENGVIQSFNPAAERIFGYSAAEVIGCNLNILMPEPHHSGHDGYLRAYLTTGQAKILGIGRQVTGLRKDGGLFPLELDVTELRRGRQRLFIGVVRDITERKRAEEALHRAHEELEQRVEARTLELRHLSRQNEQILNSASEGIIGLDGGNIITFANPAAADMTGWQVEDLIGRAADQLLNCIPGAGSSVGARHSEYMAGPLLDLTQKCDVIDFMAWRKDGSSFPVEFALSPIEENGEQVGAVLVFRDITERKQIEDKLRLASAVFETTAEAIMVLDPEFRITTANPAYSAITGYLLKEVLGKRPHFLDDEENPVQQDDVWASIRETGRWDHERWSLRKNRTKYAERISVTAVTDMLNRVVQYIVVFSDITQRKLDEERILYQANFDALTGLPNRSLFMDRLGQGITMASRTGERVGLMFIDLDGFKLVNDTLGHDMGDELLREASQRLLGCVRGGDTVARLGGDEFTIIMPNLGDLRNAPMVAQRVIESLQAPFKLGKQEAFVSASIGIATYPDDAPDAAVLLRNADAAMYRAKEQGKANFQFFTAELNAQASERMIIKNGLVKALERGEFMLYYQPKCDSVTGKLVSVEALLRWRSAEMGMVSPVKFIPVMEESGLIGLVGEWAIETACIQHRKWAEAGHPGIRVAVNLSVRQLRQDNLDEVVADILARTGVSPSGLELEITESMIMKDTENAIALLHRLSDMGIHLAMDDFGTGYSSLSYLKRFPLHTIKIDRSFVNDIAVDQDDLEIIRTIISMGHSLRRTIVAEGVETDEQLQLLREMNCDIIQGYIVSPPVPATEIDRILEEQEKGILPLA